MSFFADKLSDRRVLTVTMIVKFFFSLMITVFVVFSSYDYSYVIISLVELSLILLFTDLIGRKNIVAANIVNSVAMLLYNIQIAVLFFSGSFIEPVMLSNLRSIQDIQGNAFEYISATGIVIVCSLLPIRKFDIDRVNKIVNRLIPITLVLDIALILFLGWNYSPYCSYGSLIYQECKLLKLRIEVSNAIDVMSEVFYSDGVDGYRDKDVKLSESPNVILIFAEGLSQSIIEDDREIMPRLSDFEEISLSFTGYYNHTFATYRALIGQLYSGYQLSNLDENNLISIQQIMSMNGYHTVFLNTEPFNSDFTAYLNGLGFDEVLGETSDDLTGMANTYSDKQAFEYLYETALELSESDEPFFLTIYTFGTHATTSSSDEVYGDGSNDELNKFYNLDVQFASFLEKFNNSALTENTIIIFTADHATYQDSEFTKAFPNLARTSSFLDEIPLCIYYKGVTPEVYDVNGRNSLDLAPTILDYLDISAPNYFLGQSLFADDDTGNYFDTVFHESTTLLTTKGGSINNFSGENAQLVEELIEQYFAVKLKGTGVTSLEETQNLFESDISVELSEDGRYLDIIYTPVSELGAETYTHIWFPVWSTENDQDDIIRYPATLYEDGTWRATINLLNHTLHGEINIHVYGGDNEATDFLSSTVLILS